MSNANTTAAYRTTNFLTAPEKWALALEAGRFICMQGYSPSQAQQVVKMDDHTFLELCEWYQLWK